MTEEKDYIGHRQRIKERFMLGQGKDMADYEFLELLLTYAIPRKDTKPLAKALIKKFGSFAKVIFANKELLMSFSGLKENSIILLDIVREAAIRMTWQNLASDDEPVIATWDSLLDYCRMSLANKTREEMVILMMDAKYRVIAKEVQQRGTTDMVAIHPTEVVRSALANNAKYVVMVHNHPSGSLKPSQPDVWVTEQVKKALDGVGIKLHDHLIISEEGYYSFREDKVL